MDVKLAFLDVMNADVTLETALETTSVPDQVAIVLHSNAVPAPTSAIYIKGPWYPKLVPSSKVHIIIVIDQLLL